MKGENYLSTDIHLSCLLITDTTWPEASPLLPSHSYPPGDIFPFKISIPYVAAGRHLITAIGKVDNTNLFIENYSRIPLEIFIFVCCFLPLITYSTVCIISIRHREGTAHRLLWFQLCVSRIYWSDHPSCSWLWLPLEVWL